MTSAAGQESLEVDLLIVGAGPVGLFGAYYAGFRGLSVAIVDSLPEIGGQVTAMYPEKDIYDVGGFAVIKGRDLVDRLVQQAASADPRYLMGRTAVDLSLPTDSSGAERDGVPPASDRSVWVGLDDGTTVHAGALILTAGIGKFTPRPLPAGVGWEGRGLTFFVSSFEEYRDKDVVVVGGGDSAFDWALHLPTVARSVTLVHRREKFRAAQSTVEKVRRLPVDLRIPANVTQLLGDGWVEAVEITDVKTGEASRVKTQAVVAALGFLADLGPLTDWGLELKDRYVMVDTTMRTALPRVYAAGDIAGYAGKLRLIATGFGEVATAVNNAAVAINPSVSLFPGHSSAQD
ncbi:MAG TPA: NAD(P)/FAD-dependent oxidoreductase [Nocardioidaceae bacterium]|nr:NAD(P)/FAD-dependent oxidoreductase [Nocardioidaceae bacterium]